MKEMTGSGIFVGDGEVDALESEPTPNSKTGVRMYQVLNILNFLG
uniref:Uncharacterized protein LOC107420826 n=1 Tax=Rhizophora mucronata TaxID=61149 RepID=A0A2P2JYK6_RHIMU